MKQNIQYFYHPFQQGSLPFYTYIKDHENDSSLDIINNIDLYHQPVEEEFTAFIFFILRCFFTILAEVCNYRMLLIIKKDTSILTDVAKLQAYTIMMTLPIRLIFITLTDFIHPLNEILGQWVCSIYWFEEKISTQMVLCHSLVVALLRYVFIVHDKNVSVIGKEKLKKLFWYLSICVPTLTLLWVATDLEDLDTSPWINRCNGNDHKKFLLQSWSSLGFIKTNFHIQNDQMIGYKEKVFIVLRKISKIAQRLWMIILSSNIGEGIIYYKVIKHMIRSQNESMAKVKQLLSDDLKIIRHRRFVLGIQITILTWVVELMASFISIMVILIGMNKQSRVGENVLRELIVSVYTVILPRIVIIRDSEVKNRILQSDWYIGVLDNFGLTYKGPLRENDSGEEIEQREASEHEDQESNNLERNESLDGDREIHPLTSNHNQNPP